MVERASNLAGSRYELRRPLGEGATGAVFLALDRETGEEVALKKLFRVDQRSVQRFKREFRAIADLHHPNLVKLYDLQSERDAWFLTMEYVDGLDLHRELARDLDTSTTLDSHATREWSEPNRVARIASAFRQLAQGIEAVHRAGKLHRDLKPTNVIVAKTGRVVVLDFGLVREIDSASPGVTLDGTIAGTPAYMPPEQAQALELTPASDWYAFGVMLYEMLSGSLPIEGNSPAAIIHRKWTAEPTPLPSDAGPQELRQLCMTLLERDPRKRPGADRILHVLENLSLEQSDFEQLVSEEHSLAVNTNALSPRDAHLFGRDAELAQLREAFECVRGNQSTFVHVRGTSGSGKTSLLEYFLDDVQDSASVYGREIVVLRSRCYEREAMPFKALDGVVDALVQHLSKVDEFELARSLPREVHALTQVFPAFERLRGVKILLGAARAPRGDAAQIRRTAERALRELLTNVASLRRLMVWIDDLQWGDLDSTSVIQDWLQRPAEAPILFLLSYRSEEMQTSNCLRQLLAAAPEASANVSLFQLNLNPLHDAEVERLCEERLGSKAAWSAALIARIVSEARGNPFLALQLTALAQAKLERGEVDLAALSVEELVQRTSALLPAPARDVLAVLAIAGRPVVPQLVLTAAGVRRDGRAHIHALQGLRLVRTRIVDEVRLLEVYHDRVREAVQASLSAADSTRIHERLLRTLESGGHSDLAWLHELALGAGQSVLALRYGELAAQIASTSLAFERAAELYARCLKLTDSREDQARLWNKLGLALARCRRGTEAADAYLKASERASESDRVPLLQLAASHLLRSGRYEDGEQLVKRVMHALKIDVPATRAGMFASIAWERARFALLSKTVKPQAGIPLPPDELRRGEFYGMVAIWTATYAPLRAALFQARTLRMAYEFGESTQMARTLCLTATLSCLSGTSAAANRADAQLTLAERWGEKADHPNIRVELLSARAVCALLLGKPADAIEPSYQADEIYQTKSAFDDTGDYYHMFAVRTVLVGALQVLGRHVEANKELRELVANAQLTDNLTAILQISQCVTTMEQVLDGCAGSRARLDRERAQLPNGEFGVLHLLHFSAVLRSAAFTSDFDWGQSVVDTFWPGYEKSLVRHSAYLSYVLHVARARFILNRHVVRGESGDPASAIRKHVRWLSSSAPEPLRPAVRARFRARTALLRGDEARAIEFFQESLAQHQQIKVADDVARERYVLACLVGGAEAAQRKRDALAALAVCGIVDPEADMRGYYPELFRERRR